MKAEINKDGQLVIDAQTFVQSLDEKTLRCIAQYAIFDDLLIGGILDGLVKGEMFETDEEPPWWFSSETFNKLRARLMPLLPEITVAAVKVIESEREYTKAREEHWHEACRHFESHWPDRARLEEISKPLRDRRLDYPYTTKEQAAAKLRAVEAKIATEQPQHEMARAETVVPDMRADYLATHLWLTQHCIPTRKDDGTQMTLAERARFALEDRTNNLAAALDGTKARLELEAA